MKTRDEFIKSVREKSEIAMAEKEAARADKKIKKKRIISWSATAAACLVIAVSAGSIGNIGSTFDIGEAGSDAAVTSDGATLENTAGTAGQGGAPAADSYGGAGKHLYMLPAGIVLEDLETGDGLGITGDNIAIYMDWFYNLPDEMKLTAEEYEEECNRAEPESTVRYRFTMDFSQGEDKEGVDRTFYIVDGVEMP